MSIAIACVLIAAALPIVFTGVAKMGSIKEYDNANPRQFQERLVGWQQRAHWAQLNSYESFPFFAVGVVIAMVRNVDVAMLNYLAITFVVARALYGLCYIFNFAALRSVVWTVAMGAAAALYIMAM